MSEATKEAQRLRRALKKNRASGWRNGTVIRFRRTWHNDDRPGLSVRNPRSYTYAAVWIEATQRWYITGKGAADAREFDTQRLLSYLNAPETSDVRIATAWERVR